MDGSAAVPEGPAFEGGAFGGPPQPPPWNAADEPVERIRPSTATGQCPQGQIPWELNADGVDPLGELFQRQSGDTFQPPAILSYPITIESSRCGTPGFGSEDARLRTECDGRNTCTPTPVCPGQFEVTYSCGVGDHLEQGRVARTSNRGRLSLQCSFAPPVGEARPTRSVCVPKLCRGRSRRNAELQCVPDLTMPVLPYSDAQRNQTLVFPFFTVDRPISEAPNLASLALVDWRLQNAGWAQLSDLYRGRSQTRERLFENGVYTVRTELPVGASEAAFSTPGMRAHVWFSDVWDIDGQRVESFRCLATAMELGDTLDRAKRPVQQLVLPQDCFGPQRLEASRREAIRRRFGRSDAQPRQATLLHSEGHVSLDMEGRTLLVTGEQTQVTACAPNPPAFFYDAASNTFDLVSYYQQRRVTTLREPTTGTTRRFEFTWAPQVTFGVLEAEIRDPVITAYQYNEVPTRFSLDITWYTAFQSMYQPQSSEAFLRDRASEGAVTTERSVRQPRLEAYLYELQRPSTRVETFQTNGYPAIASVPVTTAEPTGSTVSVDVNIPADILRRFFDASRRYFIPISDTSARFGVLVCFVSGDSSRVSLRPSVVAPFDPTWMNIFIPGNVRAHPAMDAALSQVLGARPGRRTSPWGSAIPSWHERLVQQTNDRWYLDGTPRGCVWANQQLVIQPDRYLRATAPVLDSPWRGQVQPNESGDEVGSARSDGAMGQTCERLPGSETQEQCRSSLQQGTTSNGSEFNDSVYNLEFAATLVEGTAFRVASVGEIFGFQLMDTYGIEVDLSNLPDDDEEDEGGEDPPTSGIGIKFDIEYDDGELTLSAFPDYEAAATQLNRGRPESSRLQWEGDDDDGLALVFTYSQKIKIGPIPGEVTFTSSVGASLTASFTYRWRRRTGEDYACLGATEACLTPRTGGDSLTFQEAADFCAESGGRLADPTSANEAARLRTLAPSLAADRFWVGGQIGTRFADSNCAARPELPCAAGAWNTWRWLQNDALYRSEAGAIVSASYHNGGEAVGPVTLPAGLTLGRGDVLSATRAADRQAFVCYYLPAERTRYRELGASLIVGASAGIGLGVCVPSSKIGICLEGNLKIVNIEFGPEFSKWDWLIVGVPGEPTLRASSTDVRVGLDITLFSAELNAIVRAWIFSRRWNIFHYPGLKILASTLYAYSEPSFEVLP
jgi:hypothetical protein